VKEEIDEGVVEGRGRNKMGWSRVGIEENIERRRGEMGCGGGEWEMGIGVGDGRRYNKEKG